MAEGLTTNPLSPQNIRALSIPRRGVEQRQLAGLITRRSWVRVPPPLPTRSRRQPGPGQPAGPIAVQTAPGGWSEAEPPVPIPNTEVKRLSADDTGGAPFWENRALPGRTFRAHQLGGPFFFLV